VTFIGIKNVKNLTVLCIATDSSIIQNKKQYFDKNILPKCCLINKYYDLLL